MAYQARLESASSLLVTVGSNPTLSASLRQPACHSSEGTAGRSYGWQARWNMWYVYVLRSLTDNNLYVGSTNDISRRLSEHNSGKADSTKNRTRAVELEQYFKTGSGRAFLQKRIP